VRAFKTVAGVTPTNYRRENCPWWALLVC